MAEHAERALAQELALSVGFEGERRVAPIHREG